MGIRGLLDNLKSRRSPARGTIELLAVDGLDVGRRFTLFASAVSLSRGQRSAEDPRTLYLRDPTVSTHQATIRHVEHGYEIEHDSRATNPTLVNDEVVDRQRIRAGDRVQVGRVVLEVQNASSTVSGFFELPAQEAEPGQPAAQRRAQASPAAEHTAPLTALADPEATIVSTPYGLQIEEPGSSARTHLLREGDTVIGRLDGCDIAFPDESLISRQHARIERSGDQLRLVHLSRVNPTLVNGRRVSEACLLSVNDVIEIAGRVRLKVTGPGRPLLEGDTTHTNLAREMESLVARKLDIEARFAVDGSFLDVDVVQSFQLKSDTREPERIILSFERWRAWVVEQIRRHQGDVLNSNGDELMCVFEEPLQSVAAGRAILRDLPRFNAEENLLVRPFALRIGIHTGRSLVDRSRGVAYSPILDIAGHLQKAAPVDGLLISETTREALPAEQAEAFGLEEQSAVDELRCYVVTRIAR